MSSGSNVIDLICDARSSQVSDRAKNQVSDKNGALIL